MSDETALNGTQDADENKDAGTEEKDLDLNTEDAETTPTDAQTEVSSDEKIIEELHESYRKLREEVGKVIVGQQDVLERIMICILARGHALLMGVPGLAKTLMIHSLADAMSLDFSRIQFTPDLMPSDITGTDILQETDRPGHRAFEFAKGPVFANIILADEINRTPPKTQAALLETMQERQVTAAGRTYALDAPFFVLATQNPIEQEGTYPLPEAQLDRFMFLIQVEYPTTEEEVEIARLTTGEKMPKVAEVLDGPTIIKYQDLVRRIPVPDHVYDYIVKLVRSTRPNSPDAPSFVNDWLTWGAGPRAVQNLVLGAKVAAVLSGNFLVQTSDVNRIAADVLGHRVVLNFRAESEGVNSRDIVAKLIEEAQKE